MLHRSDHRGMSELTSSIVPAQQPGHGWSMYHQNIFAALVRAVENYARVWTEMERRCKAQGMDVKIAAAFDDIEEAAIPVILLAHAMVEALANWYLGLNCSARNFREIEYEGVLKKWTVIPKEWLPKYALPKNHEMGGGTVSHVIRLLSKRMRRSFTWAIARRWSQPIWSSCSAWRHCRRDCLTI